MPPPGTVVVLAIVPAPSPTLPVGLVAVAPSSVLVMAAGVEAAVPASVLVGPAVAPVVASEASSVALIVTRRIISVGRGVRTGARPGAENKKKTKTSIT